MTSIFAFLMQHPSKVCVAIIAVWAEIHCFEEFKDDSLIIPRSSSVIVKRLPAVRPGKGRASIYVNSAGPAMPTSEALGRGAGGLQFWHKGAMSKRFDGKDETPSTSTSGTVKPVVPVILAVFLYYSWTSQTQCCR